MIFEPTAGGHHTNYVAALLPALEQLIDAKLVNKVVVTTSEAHRSTAAFESELSPFSSKIDFDTSLPAFIHNVKSTRVVAAALRDAIRRNAPDYLIATTADVESVDLAIRSMAGKRALPRSVYSVGLFHYGYAGMIASIGDRLKDLVYRYSWRAGPWSEVRMVNPLLYESLKRQGGSHYKKLNIVPHPVKRRTAVDKITARKVLGIPVDGRYIGSAGQIDRRKAIPEMLSAFRAATARRTDRLLLVGRIWQPYKALIDRDFSDLVRAERLIVIDRYLSEEELNYGICALDVAALIYYPRTGLSANVLDSAYAARPVIAGIRGYTGMAIDRFDLGWSCDVQDHDALTGAIRTSLDRYSDYRPSAKAQRLMAFHDPQNYAASVLGALYESLGSPLPQVRTWEWAVTGNA